MGRTVARNLQLMARMGVYFEEQRRAALSGISDSHRRAAAGKNIFRRSARCLSNLLEDHSGVLAA